MANQNDRSRFIPIKHNAKTESFKRSAHADFATSAELKQREFTGVRNNSITNEIEFWILGNLEKKVSVTLASTNPNFIQETFTDLFAMKRE